GGGLEVVYPSEFVPGTYVHTVYGPPNINGDRFIITSFLQPQVTTPYSGVNLGPAQPMTLDTEQEAAAAAAATAGSANASQPAAGALQPNPNVATNNPNAPVSGPTSTTPANTSAPVSGPTTTTPVNSNTPGGLPPSRVTTLPGGVPGGAVIPPT